MPQTWFVGVGISLSFLAGSSRGRPPRFSASVSSGCTACATSRTDCLGGTSFRVSPLASRRSRGRSPIDSAAIGVGVVTGHKNTRPAPGPQILATPLILERRQRAFSRSQLAAQVEVRRVAGRQDGEATHRPSSVGSRFAARSTAAPRLLLASRGGILRRAVNRIAVFLRVGTVPLPLAPPVRRPTPRSFPRDSRMAVAALAGAVLPTRRAQRASDRRHTAARSAESRGLPGEPFPRPPRIALVLLVRAVPSPRSALSVASASAAETATNNRIAPSAKIRSASGVATSPASPEWEAPPVAPGSCSGGDALRGLHASRARG